MLFYKTIDNNKKDWMLFLHCICGDSSIFDAQIDNYSENFNILLIDLPGHGNIKNYNNTFSFDDISSNIINILDDLSIEKTHITSLSLGAIIASYLIINYPNRFDKALFTGMAISLPNKLALFAFKTFNNIKYFIPTKIWLPLLIYLIIPRTQDVIYRKLFYKNGILMNKKVLHNWLTLMNDFFSVFPNQIKNNFINTPHENLFIYGEYDFLFHSAFKKVFANDNLNVMLIKNTGHLCNVNSSKKFNNLAISFFKQL